MIDSIGNQTNSINFNETSGNLFADPSKMLTSGTFKFSPSSTRRKGIFAMTFLKNEKYKKPVRDHNLNLSLNIDGPTPLFNSTIEN